MIISKIIPLSTDFTWIGVCSRNVFISFFCSGVTLEITSKTSSACPPVMPAAAAASIPFKPSVFGTITLFTFFIILSLTPISTLSGRFPRIFFALAAAYAIAIGSVHPIAGTSSSFRICK